MQSHVSEQIQVGLPYPDLIRKALAIRRSSAEIKADTDKPLSALEKLVHSPFSDQELESFMKVIG